MNPAEASGAIEVSAANFETEVLLRSREVPVLIDFWATWCAPCRTLGPILDKLAREFAGRLVLAKVDIDANPELADAFRIQSVPSVLLLKDGKLADGFLGAQPEAAVRRFLEPHLGAPAPSAVDAAAELEAAGDLEGAVRALRAHLVKHAADDRARLVLTRLLLDVQRAEEAKLVFAKLSEAELASDAGQALSARFKLIEGAGGLADLERAARERPDDLDARLELGKALIAAGRKQEGLEALFEAARRDIHHGGDAPRKALIDAFTALGWEDPLTLDFQRKLSMLLTA